MLLLLFAAITLLSTMHWSHVPPLLYLLSGWQLHWLDQAQWQDGMALGLMGLILLAVLLWMELKKGNLPRSLRMTTLLCGLFFILQTCLLVSFQAQIYRAPSAALSQGFEMKMFIFVAVFWYLAWMRFFQRTWVPLAVAFLALAMALVRQIQLFPLDNGFSDMLLIIRNAGAALLEGNSPYSQAMSTTYLPAMWLSYLPAVMLGIDLRYLNVVFWAAFGILLYRAFDKEKRPLGVALLSLFFLNPWLNYRHELYLPAYLWVMAFFYWALKKKRPNVAALAFGWSIACYPFSWILFPVWIAWEAGSGKWRQALQRGAVAMGVALVVTLPFVAWDFRGFFSNVFLYWVGNVEITHYNLVYWLGGWSGSAFLLGLLQLLSVLLASRLAWTQAGLLGAFFGIASLALAVFLLANYHVSHYFFIIVVTYLMIAIVEWPLAEVSIVHE